MSAERDTAEWYRGYAQREARGNSPVYQGWALSIADDAQLRALIETLGLQHRQPSLVFACARLLGAPVGPFDPFRDWLIGHWAAVAAEAAARTVQTNEPMRCAALLPALALIAGPLALLEVGASAGLCLVPDRYGYSYGDGRTVQPATGASALTLECAASAAVPVPARMPEVVHRAGCDLHPLDPSDENDLRWLEMLVWPEAAQRRARLRAAAAIAAAAGVDITAGDAVSSLARLVASAPQGSTPVVLTSGVLVYLPFDERMRFAAEVRRLGCRWVSLEAAGSLPAVRERLPEPARRAGFVLALDEHPLAVVSPHGQWMEWIDDSFSENPQGRQVAPR